MTITTVRVDGSKGSTIIRPLTIGTIILVSGDSQTFANVPHVVVGRIKDELNNWEMLHDPNPEGQGIKGIPHYYYFFTAVDPAKMRKVKVFQNQACRAMAFDEYKKERKAVRVKWQAPPLLDHATFYGGWEARAKMDALNIPIAPESIDGA